MMAQIDLNCDCGESFGPWNMGDDAAVLRWVSSANIACGAHAGDPGTMRRTLRLTRELGVAAGAHPGYPDLQGFGRRTIAMGPDEVFESVLAQLGTLDALARAENVALRHVKPHGALYNVAARTPELAQAIASAIAVFNPNLILVGLAGSALIAAGEAAALRVVGEAFADRRYEADGSLRDRRLPGAVIVDDEEAVAQALSIAQQRRVIDANGASIAVSADTICLHGDTPGAAAKAQRLRRALEQAGVEVRAMGHDEP
jgi:5-oxoprolinase (ATP-hydrolysing) subunit A